MGQAYCCRLAQHRSKCQHCPNGRWVLSSNDVFTLDESPASMVVVGGAKVPGVHIVGPHATDLIGEGALAV